MAPVDRACERSRLFLELDSARERHLVWVSAAAGSGKSTLLASYVRSRCLPCVWYNVDARDADPAALFSYLKDAGVALGAPAASLPVLADDHPVHGTDFARRFFEMLERHLPPSGVLVFDDATDSPHLERWYELLLAGAAALSENWQLVFLSRAAPPPRFARFLASSSLALVSGNSLRFTSEEGRALIRQRCERLGLSLSSAQTDQLIDRTEGWAAGIVLALECGGIDDRQLQERLADPSEATLNFFAAEVWHSTRPELKQLFLQTAFMPSMNVALLDRLFGADLGASLLERLKRETVFASEQCGTPLVVRYHSLFKSFLLAQAQLEWSSDRIAGWRRTVGSALAEVGEAEAALSLLLGNNDFEAASTLLLAQGRQLLSQGRAQTVAAYLELFPAEMLEKNAWLAMLEAIATKNTRPEAALAAARRAFALFNRDREPSGYWLAWSTLAFAHATGCGPYGEQAPLLRLGIQALESGALAEPELQHSVRRTIAFVGSMLLPDSPDIRACAEFVLTSPRPYEPRDWAVALLHHGLNGELTELAGVLQRWRPVDRAVELGPDASLWRALIELQLANFAGDVDRTSSIASGALELAERSGLLGLSSTVLTYWAYACIAHGEEQALGDIVSRLQATARAGRTHELANYRFVAGLQALGAGDPKLAEVFLRQAYADARLMGAPVAVVGHGLALCEALCALGQQAEAHEVLERVLPRIPERNAGLRQSAELVSAALAFAEGDETTGRRALAAALCSAKNGTSRPVPLPTRACLRLLLARALELDLEPAAAREFGQRLGLRLGAPVALQSQVVLAPHSPLPEAFVGAVRGALRHLHETKRLLDNPLLTSALFDPSLSREERVKALRCMLGEHIQQLVENARTEPYHRVLRHTFVEPAETQLAAAERAGTSFGTYRRRLRAGIEQIAADLWLRAQATRLDHAHEPSPTSTDAASADTRAS